MGKKGNQKESKKKLTKKEKKKQNHLKLMKGRKGTNLPTENQTDNSQKDKKAA